MTDAAITETPCYWCKETVTTKPVKKDYKSFCSTEHRDAWLDKKKSLHVVGKNETVPRSRPAGGRAALSRTGTFVVADNALWRPAGKDDEGDWVETSAFPDLLRLILRRDPANGLHSVAYELAFPGEPSFLAAIGDIRTGDAFTKTLAAVSEDPAIRSIIATTIKQLAGELPESQRVEATPIWQDGALYFPPEPYGPAGFGICNGDEVTARRVWLEEIGPIVADSPIAAIFLGAAAAAPFVQPLGREPAFFHNFGGSSIGKSTLSLLLGSFHGWAGATPNGPDGVRTGFNWTKVFLTRYLGERGCLPYFANEMGESDLTDEQLTQLILRATGSASRGTAQRGAEGTNRSAPWFGYLFTNANRTLIVTKNEGLPPRVVETLEPCFATAADSEKIGALAPMVHGHPLRWITGHGSLDAMKTGFLAAHTELVAKGAPVDSVLGRVTAHVAMALAGSIHAIERGALPEMAYDAAEAGATLLLDYARARKAESDLNPGDQLAEVIGQAVARYPHAFPTPDTAPENKRDVWGYQIGDDELWILVGAMPEIAKRAGLVDPLPGLHILKHSGHTLRLVTRQGNSDSALSEVHKIGRRSTRVHAFLTGVPDDPTEPPNPHVCVSAESTGVKPPEARNSVTKPENVTKEQVTGGGAGYGDSVTESGRLRSLRNRKMPPDQGESHPVTELRSPSAYAPVNRGDANTCEPDARIGAEKEPGRWLYVARETFTTPPEPLSCPRDPGPSDAPGGGSQADWIAWAAQLMDADETEGEPIDWLELTADETAARLEEVAKNGREIVSLKREIEDPDAPRWAPLAPPHDPTDPDAIETAAAWDRLQAGREAREALARGDVPELSAELLDRPTLGAFPVPAIAPGPVEDTASAPVAPAERPEAAPAPTRTRKTPASRNTKAEAVPAKPRTKAPAIPRRPSRYVPMVTDGRVILGPDLVAVDVERPEGEALDVGHIGTTSETLSREAFNGGRPIVQVWPQAHESLVLPNRWRPTEAGAPELVETHPFAARAIARGVAVRLIDNTPGACYVGAAKVEIDFPAWGSGDWLPKTGEVPLDLAQLESALVKFSEALGIVYATSAGATMTHLIENRNRDRSGKLTITPAGFEPELSPEWLHNSRGGYSRPPSAAELERPYVRAFDRSGSFGSAWKGLVTGLGHWEHLTGPVELPKHDYPPGYWLIDVDPLREALGLGTTKPDPFAKLGAPEGPQFYTTPLAQLARDLADAAGLDLRALSADVQPLKGEHLTKPGEAVKCAREMLAADPSPEARAALAVVKTGYSAAPAQMEHSHKAPDELARAVWNRSMIDRWGANLWRSLEKADPAPFAWIDTDTALFALDGPDALPWPAKYIGTGYGQWKPKGAPAEMATAAELLTAGDVLAVEALCIAREKGR